MFSNQTLETSANCPLEEEQEGADESAAGDKEGIGALREQVGGIVCSDVGWCSVTWS